MLAQAFNHSALESEAEGSLSLNPVWSTDQAPRQLRLHR